MHGLFVAAGIVRKLARTMALIVISGMLAACGTSDDRVLRSFSSPGKYHVNDCGQLKNIGVSLEARIKELEILTAKAKEDTGGGLVSALSYEPEIFTLRGDMAELKREQASQNCPGPADQK